MSSKKHDSVFDDVLSNFDETSGETLSRPGSRFLKRSTAIADRPTGERQEKVLQWVSPDACRMWARHNRDYALLNEDTCRDLIDGIRAQGRQEFPAIVRRLKIRIIPMRWSAVRGAILRCPGCGPIITPSSNI